MSQRAALVGLALSGSAVLAIFTAGLRLPAVPPARSADAPANQFSAARAHRHIQAIADEPRPTGSAALTRARAYILNELRRSAPDILLETQEQLLVESFAPGIASGTRVQNIIARLPGSAGSSPDSRPILLLAHYDSAANSPGANDDGAGVAVLLEMLRALYGGPSASGAESSARFRNDLILLFTDGEERGLLGARAYVRHHPANKRHASREEPGTGAIVFNFEARGSSGPALMFQTGPESDWLVRAFAARAPAAIGSSIAPELFRLLPYGTDFQVFARAGHAGLNFAYINNTLHYHTPQDTPESVDPRSLQHHGENVLALLRDLLDRDFSARPVESHTANGRFTGVTYLPTPFGLLVYANWWNAFALLLSGVLWLLCFAPVLRDRSALRVLRQFTQPLGLLLLGALAIGLVWQAVLYCLPELRATLFTGETYRPGFLKTGLQLSGLAVASGFALRWNRRRDLGLVLAAGTGGLLLSGGLTVWWAPGAAYFFVLPAFGLVLTTGPILYVSGNPRALYLAVTVPGLLVIALICGPLVRLLGFGLFGVSTQPALMLVYAPWLFLLPVFAAGLSLRRWLVPTITVASAGCLIYGAQLAAFSAEQPRPNSVFYAVDGDAQTATRFSCDARLDAWTGALVRGAAQEIAGAAPLENYLPVLRRCLPGLNRAAGQAMSAKLPPSLLSGPIATELSRGNLPEGDGIRLRVAVRSDRGAPRMYAFVRPAAGYTLRSVAVDGVAVPERALGLAGGAASQRSLLLRALGWLSGDAFVPDRWVGLLLASSNATAAPNVEDRALLLEFELVRLEQADADGGSGTAAEATRPPDPTASLEVWLLDHTAGLPAGLQPPRPADAMPGGRHPFSDGVFVLRRWLL